jgi:ketosteroid isomerase-like protein
MDMTSTTAESHDEAQVRETILARIAAITNKRPNDVRLTFADTAVGFFVEPPLSQSPQQEDLEGWFSTWIGPIGYEVGKLKIAVGGEIAYCHCLSHLTGARVNDEHTDFWFRETMCFRRVDTRWLITHVHESVPMLMDGSNMAAVDLRP